MKNAHLRFGRLEYRRSSIKTDTKFSVPLNRYIGEKEQAHLMSVYGGDAEIGAISAAVHEGHSFTVTFPDGGEQVVHFGKEAACYRGQIQLPGRKRGLRHLVAVSTTLHANGSAGRTILMNLGPQTWEAAWATLVSLLGLPADPHWGRPVLEALRAEKRLTKLEGVGCKPVAVQATREDLLQLLGKSLAEDKLRFPETNGPIRWPAYTMQQLLSPIVEDEEQAA
jgi:hypothetical protein